MARSANQQRLNELRDAIKAHPDRRAGFFARLLGTDNKSVTRSLPQLEERGDLLMEDDRGRLRWFGRRR